MLFEVQGMYLKFWETWGLEIPGTWKLRILEPFEHGNLEDVPMQSVMVFIAL